MPRIASIRHAGGPAALRRAAAIAAGALAAAALWAAPAPAAPDPSAFVAVSPDATTHFLALADRMVVGGALLVLFVVLAAITATLWRDARRRGRRT